MAQLYSQRHGLCGGGVIRIEILFDIRGMDGYDDI